MLSLISIAPHPPAPGYTLPPSHPNPSDRHLNVTSDSLHMLQVETIMLSIISMLSSPNDESPANIDAAKEWREDREGFKKRVARVVRHSQESL